MRQVTGKAYRVERTFSGSHVLAKDKSNLESLGFKVVPLDFPVEVKLTRKQRYALAEAWKLRREPRYRPDYLVFGFGLVFFWEVKFRDWDFEDALADGYFIVPETQYRMLRVWRSIYKVPVYVSVWFGKEWLGYQDIKNLSELQVKYSSKHGENFVLLSATQLETKLEKILGMLPGREEKTQTQISRKFFLQDFM